MCRKAQWTYAALAAGLLFGSAQAAAATITATVHPENAPASEGATLAMCSGALMILFGSVRRKKRRQ